MPQTITHDVLFKVKAPPSSVIGTARVSVDRADHAVVAGTPVTVTATVTGAVEVWVNTLTGRIDLPPSGGTFSFIPLVSGPFPLFARDAAGGVVIKPMSVVVKKDRPALDPLAPPTLTTVQDGPLDDPATWGGRLPTADETVEVRHACTYGGRTFWCGRLINTGAIVVRGGMLHTTDYDDRAVGDLTLDGRGVDKSLMMLHNRPRHPNDVDDFWRCAWFRGRLTVQGEPVTPRVHLSAPARAGDMTLSLSSPVTGWKVGHKLVLQDTRQLAWSERPDNSAARPHREEEVLVVRGVSADGRTVHLLDPLRYDHRPAINKWGEVVCWPVVAHLIRNAGILTSDMTDPTTRAHVLVQDRARLEMDYWVVHGTGRTLFGRYGVANRPGRNPLRLDRLTGPAEGVRPGGPRGQYQFVLNNGVSVDPPPLVPLGESRVAWGVVLRDSHDGSVRNNVVFNWGAAGIVFEDGNESFNDVSGNVVVAVTYSDATENTFGQGNAGHTGAGIWCRGGNNVIEHNWVSGAARGYIVSPYMAEARENSPVPRFPGADTRAAGQYDLVNLRKLPLRRFADNTAFGGWMTNGIEIWWVGVDGATPYPDMAESVVEGLTVCHSFDKAYYNYTTNHVTFRNCRFVNDPAQNKGIGFFSSDYWAFNFKMVDCLVHGYDVGYLAAPIGNQRVEGGDFYNATNFSAGVLWVAGSPPEFIPPRTVTLSGVTQAWSREAVALDGTPHQPQDSTNLRAANVFNVVAHQGDLDDSFRLYWREQAAGAIMPQSVTRPTGEWVSILACPEAGLTNAQAQAKYGIAWGGAIAPPGAAVRDGFVGLAVPV